MTKVFKVVISGPPVGKTTLLHRLAKPDDPLPAQLKSTIGCDLDTVELHDSNATRLQLWDTAGKEQYKTITNALYRGIGLAVLVYALDSEKSLDDAVSQFISAGKVGSGTICHVFLVGTRSDLPRTVQQRHIDDAMEKLDFWLIGAKGEAASRGSDPFQHFAVKSFEVSGLINIDVDILFEAMRSVALSKDYETHTGAEQHLDVDVEEKGTKSGDKTCNIM